MDEAIAILLERAGVARCVELSRERVRQIKAEARERLAVTREIAALRDAA